MNKTYTALDVQKIFSADGDVCRSLANFEVRYEQIEMAQAVQQAFLSGRHLAVEAGTGVGKSFAYLVPAADLASNGMGRVLVSTFTITLQEQLVNKDIPFLNRCLPRKFNAVLAKGRSNYICKRRLNFRDCFYWAARRRLENADIIVANHALLFSDLILKEQGVSLLPGYKFIVIDEAHNIEHVAEDHFGIDLSDKRVKFVLDNLYNRRTQRGLLTHADAKEAIDLVYKIGRESARFFKEVQAWYERTKDETKGRCYKNFIDDTISGYLKDLSRELAKLAKRKKDEDEKYELMRFVDLCKALIHDLESFLSQANAEHIYWLEVGSGRTSTIRLKSAPLNCGPEIRRCLFDKYDSVVLTSATLCTGNAGEKNDFDFFAGRIGLNDFDAARLGSPFDYQKQVKVYVEKDLPNPNQSAFIEGASEVIKKYLAKTTGGAFVLFTSYAMLEDIAGRLSEWLAGNHFKLLQQGADLDRATLLRQFKAKGSNVLFGTDSFWQGVDVPGQALSAVIIVRLPFAAPDQPLLAGRLEQISQTGGNPFNDYQLPSAIIKFKQGFGRLIRSKTDSGIVVVLDSRIINKPYGRKFLAAIPKCEVVVVTNDKV
jgi:ATP-dependent DNA helicase DinG